MRNSASNRVAITLVTGVAVSAIILSQVAFAQGRRDRSESGVSELIGRARIRPDDSRFQPAAMMVLNEATGGGSAARGRTVFSETILVNYISKYIYKIPDNAARGHE